MDGTLYFTADDGANGKELWKSDGTDAGTVMVKNINAVAGSAIDSLVVMNGVLYFTADDGINGRELWKSDGTNAGTVILKNINPGINNSSPDGLTNINGVLYFSADDGANGKELWKSDGTAAGTVLVKDIYNGPNSSLPGSFTLVDNTLFFSADDGVAGRELWKSSGLPAGTAMVKDIFAGISSSNPTVLTRIGSNLLFAADDGTHGNELWISNGTETNTRLMHDIEPGATSADPSAIVEVNGKILASVFTTYFGREIWVADAPAAIPLPLELLEFKGHIVEGNGLLNWKTDNESNTSSFVIERSTDGRGYTSLGSVAAFNSPGMHYYEFTDVNIASLGAPVIHYRLKQTDIDGRFTYSTIVTLAINAKINFVNLYPNPVKNKINLTFNVPQKERLQWQLTDNTGRKVKSGVYDLSAGSTAVTIDVPTLHSGIYFIQLNGSALRQVIKVVKQ